MKPSQTCDGCKFEDRETCGWMSINYYPSWLEWQNPPTKDIDAMLCETWKPRKE